MELTLKAPGHELHAITSFWERYFRETPRCSHEGCMNVAHEVDPFFPYLDDMNRCGTHGSNGDHNPSLS